MIQVTTQTEMEKMETLVHVVFEVQKIVVYQIR